MLSLLTGQRLVVAPRGELHAGALQLKPYKKKPFLWLTRFLPKNRIVWHATDPAEELAIRRHFVDGRVRCAPVRYAPDTPNPLTQRLGYHKQPGAARLVFMARITPKKGLRFLLERLEQHTGGSIELDVFGPVADKTYWQTCREHLAHLPVACTVRYRGAIKHEQVNDIVKKYDFFVLPTLGENFGHAIFEALSAGIPVLISDQTPWRALTEQQAGWDLPLTKPVWADALTQAVGMTAETYAHWSGQARTVADAYLRDNRFEQPYLTLFSPNAA